LIAWHIQFERLRPTIESSICWSRSWKTVPKQDIQQFWNNEEDVSNFIKKTVSKEIEIVKKQFENREEELLKEIEQKNNVIQIKDNQTQKYALLKVQEEKEKKEWIEKYEQANDKKGEWIRKFYWVRTYLINLHLPHCFKTVVYPVLEQFETVFK
jgi:2-succinyl-5-enolpyruvyl-6-hydroxy-3-cyclohexene-1-carboxylate synthase